MTKDLKTPLREYYFSAIVYIIDVLADVDECKDGVVVSEDDDEDDEDRIGESLENRPDVQRRPACDAELEKCVNSLGTYTCLCQEGYSRKHGMCQPESVEASPEPKSEEPAVTTGEERAAEQDPTASPPASEPESESVSPAEGEPAQDAAPESAAEQKDEL